MILKVILNYRSRISPQMHKFSTNTFIVLRRKSFLHEFTYAPFKQVYCSFHARGARQVDHATDMKNDSIPIMKKEISEAFSTLTRTLNLMCDRLGLQEGTSLSGTKNEHKSGIRTVVQLVIAFFSALIYMGSLAFFAYVAYFAVPWIKKKFASMSKGFKAEIPDVTFNDVKGIDEVKQELQDIVEFLRDPARFTNLGAKLPKGTLLIGPPGTGKTLLARAIAGEAKVPFYYASGAEFDQMFVGLGSARIRALFAEARENAPCIIFIDEIDACGGKRSSSPQQSPYARMTINQLLQEMDGFQVTEGIIVIGATNTGEVLDKALTRPGRFDTEVKVLPPDIKGRKEILELYSNKIIGGSDIDLEKIACLTGGMTGADLSNLVNHAALRAASLQKSLVQMQDFEFALDKLRLGPELKSRLRTEKELENTAFHEAGHALVAFHTPGSWPLFKVTIGQRGASLGHTSMVPPPEDENNMTKAKIFAQIDILMGGRVAEELLRGSDNVTTGATSDLETATSRAYRLVCDFGMSETLGFVAYDHKTESHQNKMMIENEVNSILKTSYERAKQLLLKHTLQHRLLAKALLKYETLSLDEIKTLLAENSIDAVQKARDGTILLE